MVKVLHAAGIEVHARRGLQPHRRGQSARADAFVPRHRQRLLLPAVRRQPALLRRLHRHRQHPQSAAPARAADAHGQPALLGARDARRRLSLRSGLRACPRAARRRPAAARSSTPSARTRCSRRSSSSPSPGTSAAAATRSATSRPAGPSGTTSTATRCAATGRATADCSAIWRAASPARATCTRRRGRKPNASINFITAHDGFTLADLVSYNDKHNEANGEDNRDGHDDNRSLELRRRGPTDDAAVLRAAPAPEAQPHRDAAPVAGRADDARRATSSGAPSAATTTPTARTTRSPGSTGAWTTGAGICWSSSNG